MSVGVQRSWTSAGRGERRRAGCRAVGRALMMAVALAVLLAGLVGVQVPPAGAAEPASAWTWPLEGSPAVARDFAPPAERYGSGHRGVDLGGTPGAVVRAAGDGRVSYAGLLAGRGVVVVVHGDLRTTYEPVSAGVDVGRQVAAGEPLGTLAAGHAGCPASACLHWGLRRGEDYLDPLSLVSAGPPRLLPLSDPPGAVSLPAPAGMTEVLAEPAPAQPPVPLTVPAAEAVRTPAPVADHAWALRSAQTPAAAVALVALLAGLALLTGRRRSPRPTGAGTGPAAAVGREAAEPAAGPARPVGSAPVLVDLAAERSRRRPVA